MLLRTLKKEHFDIVVMYRGILLVVKSCHKLINNQLKWFKHFPVVNVPIPVKILSRLVGRISRSGKVSPSEDIKTRAERDCFWKQRP